MRLSMSVRSTRQIWDFKSHLLWNGKRDRKKANASRRKEEGQQVQLGMDSEKDGRKRTPWS